MKRPMVLHFYRSECNCPGGHCVSPARDWRWRIRASNGRIIADSAESYRKLSDCARGAWLVTGLELTDLHPGDDYGLGRFVVMGGWAKWRVIVDA